MLGIIGLCGRIQGKEGLCASLKAAFETEDDFRRYVRINRKDVFLDFEYLNSKSSSKYYYIDTDKNRSCFIIGNIFSFPKSDKETGQTENMAERILLRYNRGGLDFVKDLRGEFNIILVDQSKTLLINDKFGLSPMYIYETGSGVIFSSNADMLIRINENSRVDYESVSKFLVYGFVPDGKTFIFRLYNQPAGSVVCLEKGAICVRKYYEFNKLNLSKIQDKEVIHRAKATFNEAVSLRAPGKTAFLDLSGGWDTRFILANLLELRKECIAVTDNRNEEDAVIAKKVARASGIKHFYLRALGGPKDSIHNVSFDFRIRKKPVSLPSRRKLSGALLKTGYITASRFAGLFGTECFGYAPDFFRNREGINFHRACREMFTRDFLSKLQCLDNHKSPAYLNSEESPGYQYRFLSQIGRSYLCIGYPGGGFERPTKFFAHMTLTPFADTEFITFLSSLDYKKHMHYKLYERIFEKYYPFLLKIPWTNLLYRKQNPLRKRKLKTDSAITDERIMIKRQILDDKKFRLFLKNNAFVRKESNIISNRLKELFFVYKWFEARENALNG